MLNILGYRRILGLVVGASNTVVAPDAGQMSITGVTYQMSDCCESERQLSSKVGAGQGIVISDNALEHAVSRMASKNVQGVAFMLDEDFIGSAVLTSQMSKKLTCEVMVTPTEALAAAIASLGLKRAALISPFFDIDNAVASRRIADMGCEIVRSEALGFPTAAAPACTTFLHLRERFESLVNKDVEAIIQIGHNLPLGRLVDNLEEDFGLPVLAINHVTVWHALRQLGIFDVVPGVGRLFIHN